MVSYIQDLLPGSRSEQSRMLRNFSVNEFAVLTGTYKHMFKDQLRQPTADNNHIVNYNLKLQNYLIVNSSVHMLSAGMFTFLVKGAVGNYIDRVTLNYLGARRQIWAQLIIYFFVFYQSFSWLNNSKRLNVNHLINPRDFNGELMMNLTLKFFPRKVNQDKYRQALMAKYEGQIIKITSFEQMMGQGGPEHYKMANPGAVTTYIQENTPNAPQMGAAQGFPAMPSQLSMPGIPQFGHPGSLSNPMLMAQQMQPQGPPQIQHAQDQHMKQILQQPQQQAQPQQAQQSQTQQPPLPTTTAPQTQAAPQDVDPQRARIVDQLRAQQQKSPYLSTNPLLTPQAPAGYASPYLNVTQEIQKSTTGGGPLETQRMQDAMNNYYIQNVSELQHLQDQSNNQGTGYRYQGHYFNVAQQAMKDSS